MPTDSTSFVYQLSNHSVAKSMLHCLYYLSSSQVCFFNVSRTPQNSWDSESGTAFRIGCGLRTNRRRLLMQTINWQSLLFWRSEMTKPEISCSPTWVIWMSPSWDMPASHPHGTAAHHLTTRCSHTPRLGTNAQTHCPVQGASTWHPVTAPSNSWHLAMAPHHNTTQQWHPNMAPSNGTAMHRHELSHGTQQWHDIPS